MFQWFRIHQAAYFMEAFLVALAEQEMERIAPHRERNERQGIYKQRHICQTTYKSMEKRIFIDEYKKKELDGKEEEYEINQIACATHTTVR